MPTNYVQISSGLGSAAPTNIFVVPVLFEGQVKAVIELASFYRFNETHLNFLGQLTESIGIVLNTITATMRTEELLKQSQSLATELQKTNEELEEKAELLAKQNAEVEQKNRETIRPASHWKTKPHSSRSPAATNRSSWRTCPTSSGRRSIRSSSCRASGAKLEARSPRSRSNSRRPFMRPARTCSS